MSGRIVVFAKLPEAGRVKTRLVPPLAPREAAAFYRCMLEDVLETTANAAARTGLHAMLALDPFPVASHPLVRETPCSFSIVAQRGRDLGRRMAAAVCDAAAAGELPVLLRGSDSPALSESAIVDGLAALTYADIVISPDLDGGYGLVGLRRCTPSVFDHPMSTPSVLADTLANAARAGLRTKQLEPHFDIDRIDDLRHLAAGRRETPCGCTRTLAFADAHDLWRYLRGAQHAN
jgi:rSAM/selenodomain-associated transferase 1